MLRRVMSILVEKKRHGILIALLCVTTFASGAFAQGRKRGAADRDSSPRSSASSGTGSPVRKAARAESPTPAALLTLSTINVGAGNCVILACPGSSERHIFDCGSVGKPVDLTEEKIVGAVKQALGTGTPGFNAHVWLSHGDRDHINLMGKISLKSTDTRIRAFGGPAADYRRELEATFLYERIRSLPSQPAVDSNIPICADRVTATVLALNDGANKNANSLFMRITYGRFTANIPGDSTGDTLKAIVARRGALNLPTTIHIAAHHGARTHESNSAAWASAFRPKVVLFSAGTRFGHPTTEAVDSYAEPDSTDYDRYVTRDHTAHAVTNARSDTNLLSNPSMGIYNTRNSGNITITTDGTHFSIFTSAGTGDARSYYGPVAFRWRMPSRLKRLYLVDCTKLFTCRRAFKRLGGTPALYRPNYVRSMRRSPERFAKALSRF